MPGRTPTEAFEAFIGPIRGAVSCLARAKLTFSEGARSKVETAHAWNINDGAGVTTGPWEFEASMNYKIIPAEAGYRVTTLAYHYRLAYDAQDLVRWHWHPNGRSPAKFPHLHLHLPLIPAGRQSLK